MCVCSGQHVSQVVSQAAGGPSAWGPFTWIAPPPPAILPPYLQNFVQVRFSNSSMLLFCTSTLLTVHACVTAGCESDLRLRMLYAPKQACAV